MCWNNTFGFGVLVSDLYFNHHLPDIRMNIQSKYLNGRWSPFSHQKWYGVAVASSVNVSISLKIVENKRYRWSKVSRKSLTFIVDSFWLYMVNNSLLIRFSSTFSVFSCSHSFFFISSSFSILFTMLSDKYFSSVIFRNLSLIGEIGWIYKRNQKIFSPSVRNLNNYLYKF